MSSKTSESTPTRDRPRRASPAQLPPGVNALLTPAQVAVALCMDLRTFRRLRKTDFPVPDSPDGVRPRWKTSTVNAWIDQHYTRKG